MKSSSPTFVISNYEKLLVIWRNAFAYKVSTVCKPLNRSMFISINRSNIWEKKKYIYIMEINWNYVAIAVARSEGPCTRMCFECAPWTQCAYLRSILLCLQFTFGKWKWKYKHHSKLYFFNWNYESVDLHRIQFLLQNISNWFCSICFDSSICDIWTLDCSEMMFQAMIFYSFIFEIIQLLFLCSTK